MKPAKIAEPHPLAALVDELGALEQETAPLASKFTRIEMLRKAIRQHYDDSPGDQSFEAPGARYLAHVGARRAESRVNIAKLVKVIGLKAFANVASCTLRALEACPPGTAAAAVESGPTGPRGLKTFERGI